jgi:Reverse transcriptase (RNA-dependent DNA polymerase)
MYADDIMLIAPSVSALQEMLTICEQQLLILEMVLNPKKCVCLRFGPRYENVCQPLVTSSGHQLSWVQTCRYLGVYLLSARYFKCCFRNAKKSYFRSFNSVFSRVGRVASEDVVIKLVATKCVPVILYGLDACPVNASDRHSLDFVLTRCLMKLFNTGSNAVINECMNAFQVKKMSDCVIARKLVFLIDIVNLTILYVKLCPVWLVKNSWRLAECN